MNTDTTQPQFTLDHPAIRAVFRDTLAAQGIPTEDGETCFRMGGVPVLALPCPNVVIVAAGNRLGGFTTWPGDEEMHEGYPLDFTADTLTAAAESFARMWRDALAGDYDPEPDEHWN